jgi:hypothetical protein
MYAYLQGTLVSARFWLRGFRVPVISIAENFGGLWIRGTL